MFAVGSNIGDGGLPHSGSTEVAHIEDVAGIEAYLLDTNLDWVSGPIVGAVELKYGHVAEGSTREVLLSNGSKRKVRLLSHIVQSVLSPQVKLQAEKHSHKGRGRPCKAVVPSSTSVDISLSNSDLRIRKEAILEEAASTGLGLKVNRRAILSVLSKQRVAMVCFDTNMIGGLWSLEEQSCGMIVAYAPCETGAQVKLWRRLIVVHASLALPVCCGGDFNAFLTL
ncbi:hypothetical protein V6N13_042841 [Hibiscus sabdariffa]